MIDIVTVSYFRIDFTLDMLPTLKAFTTTPCRLILIDNGSDDQTVMALNEAREDGLIDELILLPKNLGLEPAKNIALRSVSNDLVGFPDEAVSVYVDTDNDIIVPPPDKDGDWLSKLLKLMTPEYAAIALPPQVFIGANKEEMFRDAKGVLDRDFVGGSMRLMRTEAVRKVGGWRDNPKDMVEANRGEEHYICGKLRKEGYKVGYAVDIPCFHQFGEDQWGYKDGEEHYHRPQQIPTDKMYGTKEAWLNKFEYKYE